MIYKNKGFALTETLLAIAVIVVIGIAVYPLYQNSLLNSKVEKTINDIVLLSQNVHHLYGTQHNFSSLASYPNGDGGMQKLDDMGLLPEGMGSDGLYTNAWGGEITVFGTNPGKQYIWGPEGHLGINLSGIPSDACVHLTTQIQNRLPITYMYTNGVGSYRTTKTEQVKTVIDACKREDIVDSKGTLRIFLK